jgi:hypothetical protein
VGVTSNRPGWVERIATGDVVTRRLLSLHGGHPDLIAYGFANRDAYPGSAAGRRPFVDLRDVMINSEWHHASR